MRWPFNKKRELQQVDLKSFDRYSYVLKNIDKNHLGIEIAPYFAPMASKTAGYNCFVLDVFSTETLISRAAIDPNIPENLKGNIELVDYVGSATEIAALVPKESHGTFDYILSSHNFEHLPNPIKFLQGCNILLREGGILSMAVPESRACFDYFRFPTDLPSWITAFRENRQKPSREQIFALKSRTAVLNKGSDTALAFSILDPPSDIGLIGDLDAAYQDWVSNEDAVGYEDTHCSIMTPASLELLLSECKYLGLISFDIEEISEVFGCEFFVRLRNVPKSPTSRMSPAEMMQHRERLFHKIFKERADRPAF